MIDPHSYSEGVPWYTAERFRLPNDWIERIRFNIAADIHGALQSLYNTSTGLALEESIRSIVTNAGYKWEKGFVSVVDQKEVDVVVPELVLPRILIMSSYNLTTASSQSERARAQKSMYEQVNVYNASRNRRDAPDVQLINVVDGAGWLSRGSDLREMHRHCDYALAWSHLPSLTAILHHHMRQ